MQRSLTVPTDTVDHPVGCLEVGGLGSPDHDVLHVPPGQILVRLEGEGTDTCGQRRRRGRASVTTGTVMV